MTSTATYPTISNWLDNHRDELIQKSCYIFEHPETAYKEKLSSKCLADYLETQGFQIEWNTAGIETAFTAAWTNSDIDITKIQPAGKTFHLLTKFQSLVFSLNMMLFRKSDTHADTIFLEQQSAQLPVH